MSSFKYRKGTSYSVAFPTAPSLQAKPGRVEILQRQFEHDILIMEFERSSSLWFSVLKTGTPVVFRWSQGGVNSSWVGYVINVSKTSAAERTRPMKIYCIGASYVLKARAARTFKNVSVTDAARKIAKEFGLEFVGENSSRKFPQLSMTGQTYWQWLQEQAARIGYGLYVRGATLYLRPMDKIVNASASIAPTLSLEKPAIPAGIQAPDRTLDRFRIINGDLVENGETPNTVKVTAGVNPLTGKPVTGSQNPKTTGQKLRKNLSTPLFADYADEVVHGAGLSKQAAKDLAEAARFTTPAELSGQGDYRITPYNVVYLEGTGIDTDGYWLIKEVRHIFLLTGQYQIEAKVATDGIGSNAATAFRTAKPPRLGTINMQEKVLQSLANGKSRRDVPRLVQKIPGISQTQQGFLELRAFWRGG